MMPDLARLLGLADDLRRMIRGFDGEFALAWPVLADGPGEPVIASVGDDRHVVVTPERVFGYALRLRSRGVVLAHNHAVDIGPSAADLAVTRRLVAAGHLLGVPLVAHLVVEPASVHDLVSGQVLVDGLIRLH